MLESESSDGTKFLSALNLVDLAGTESAKHTNAEGQRMKEGGNINKSLLSLSLVITALSEKKEHVNFRDSKLTRLLQPSLSGGAKMSIICCITPASGYVESTLSTLQFAQRAKKVKTNAKVNEFVEDSVLLRRAIKEMEELRAKQRETESAMKAAGGNDEELNRIIAEKNEEIAAKDVSTF